MATPHCAVDAEAVAGPTLPEGVYPIAGKYILQLTRGGKRYVSPVSWDLNFLHHWRVNMENELDDAGVPATRKRNRSKRAEHISAIPGVYWVSRYQKWRGSVYDRLLSIEAGKTKYLLTCLFKDEADCIAALATLRAAEQARFEAEVVARKAADPLLDGLERAPESVKDAVPKTVYWCLHKNTKYVPYRGVASARQYKRACLKCYQIAFPNTPGGAATHCTQHGGGRRCPGPVGCDACPLGIAVQNGKRDVYDGRCVRCFCTSFPNDARARNAKGWVHAKEQATVKALETAFPDHNWVFDKTFSHRTFVVGTCSTRFRPDARFCTEDRVVIVEIDEHSHRAYECAKEREREHSFVLQNLGKTVVMIRFNPDAYTDYDGRRHPSCFTPADKDHCTVHVHPKQQRQWEQRIAELVRTIETLSDPEFLLPPKQEDRPLLVCELFYDDINSTPEDRRVAKELAVHRAIGKRQRRT